MALELQDSIISAVSTPGKCVYVEGHMPNITVRNTEISACWANLPEWGGTYGSGGALGVIGSQANVVLDKANIARSGSDVYGGESFCLAVCSGCLFLVSSALNQSRTFLL